MMQGARIIFALFVLIACSHARALDCPCPPGTACPIEASLGKIDTVRLGAGSEWDQYQRIIATGDSKEVRKFFESIDVQLAFFTAEGCPPCREADLFLKPLIDKGYPIAKCQVEKQSELAKTYQVQATPTFVCTRAHKEVARIRGKPKGNEVDIVSLIEQSIDKSVNARAIPDFPKAPVPDPVKAPVASPPAPPPDIVPEESPPPPLPTSRGIAAPVEDVKPPERLPAPPALASAPSGPQTVIFQADSSLLAVLQSIADNTKQQPRPAPAPPVSKAWSLPSPETCVYLGLALFGIIALIVTFAKQSVRAAVIVICIVVAIGALSKEHLGAVTGGGSASVPYVIIVEEGKTRPQWAVPLILSQKVAKYCEDKGGKFVTIDRDIKTVDASGQEVVPAELAAIIAAAEAHGELPDVVICTPDKKIIAVEDLPKNGSEDDLISIIQKHGG